MVSGQKVEKVFNHEDADYAEFCCRNEKLRVASTKALSYSGTTVPTIVSLSYFNYALSAIVGGLFVLSGLMDLGSLSAYLVYVRQSAMPMNQFTQQINFLLSALSGAERIFTMMEEQPEVDEGTVTLCNVTIHPDGSRSESKERTGDFAWRYILPDGTCELIPLRGDVRFFGRDLRLHSGKARAEPHQPVCQARAEDRLRGLHRRGQDHHRQPDQPVLRDRRRRHHLRRHRRAGHQKERSAPLHVHVIQDTHLFTGTIADNIRYGRLDATDEEIRTAAQLANADSFIRRLPEGYDTMLYSDGANLSQGQRQLLAIARAAVAHPPVLVLDEATSSVDTHTEALIENGMDALMDGRTVFVIAHRLSTVRNAKAIMVLEKGEIIEPGRPRQPAGTEGPLLPALHRSI